MPLDVPPVNTELPSRAPRNAEHLTCLACVRTRRAQRASRAIARNSSPSHNFPGAHWTHLRTTNVIESAFGRIRHRSSRPKGCVTRRTTLSTI